MLQIKSVTKKFGDITALEGVSFDVDEGDFVFITGPSGAGKTTIVRLILREFLPDSGEIILDNKDITKIKDKEVPKLRQKIGVVFQDFKLLDEKTLRENVEIALAVIGLSSTDWKARVNHVLDLVGLSDRSELFPSQLSGGELQRVSLARALVVNPKIIIADEPTGNLDWETADMIMQLFEKINEEGKTIIMATHHRLIVDKFGKHIVELNKGKLVNDKGGKSAEKSGKKSDKSVKSGKGKS
jgi:cell division transport system ATP-binding protein